jgi:putative ABC transport system permease protein
MAAFWQRGTATLDHLRELLPKPAHEMPELYGVSATYAPIHSLKPVEGKFFDVSDDASSAAVCVLGERAKVDLLGYGPRRPACE